MAIAREEVRRLAAELLDARHLVTGGGLTLLTRHEPSQRYRWEVFQGRLLDPAHTRQERMFETWNLHLVTREGPCPEAVLSLLLDQNEEVLHVVRGVESLVWEGYEAESGVYLSRERRKWVRERIASFSLEAFADSRLLREEVASSLGRAVTGDRLPLTPVEAPLPGFSFGQLWYVWNENAGSERDVLSDHRALEFALRSSSVEEVARRVRASGQPGKVLLERARRMFLDVSLSPWTDFTKRTLGLLDILEGIGFLDPEEILDFESWLLRLLGRHLTAYDLVTFHHRGANYPDALLLDAILANYLVRLERAPEAFQGEPGRMRRRALRQAYLLRRRYEGHPVPDVPTSPGEQTRVLPDDCPRVPDEQVLQPTRRRRRLFADDPTREKLPLAAREVLKQSLADLVHEEERLEMGAAVFLDRPFGGAKGTVEPDGTLLLASLGYSRFVAGQRLRLLEGDLKMAGVAEDLFGLSGLPVEAIGGPVRQGTVSLADASRSGPDFVFRFTLPGSVRSLRKAFHFGEWEDRLQGPVLIARSRTGPGLVVYREGRPILEFEPNLDEGYVSRRGLESPRAGLRITRVDGEILNKPFAARRWEDEPEGPR